MINPTLLALMEPRTRAILVLMDSLPLAQRRAAFEEWLSRQPDSDEIRAQVDAADPNAPMPGVHFG